MAKLSYDEAERLMAQIMDLLKEYTVKVEVGRAGEPLRFIGADGSEIPMATSKYDAEALDSLNFLASVDLLIYGLYTNSEEGERTDGS